LHSGIQGNIVAYDINTPCCLTAVKAVNTVAFQGGQDEREYTVITQGDINTAATALKTALAQSTHAALAAQLALGEGLITPTCIVQSIPDHRPGDEATHVKISVSESCPAIAYESPALEEQAAHVLTNVAARRLGAHYLLVGAIQVSVIRATIIDQKRETASITVHIDGTWAYHLSQQEQQSIARHVAGESKQQATLFLLHFSGVSQVTINVPGAGNAALPEDPNRIRILVLYPLA